MCTVFKVGLKCCKDGWIFKNTHCGGIGCEHDTLSITDMAWDYWTLINWSYTTSLFLNIWIFHPSNATFTNRAIFLDYL